MPKSSSLACRAGINKHTTFSQSFIQAKGLQPFLLQLLTKLFLRLIYKYLVSQLSNRLDSECEIKHISYLNILFKLLLCKIIAPSTCFNEIKLLVYYPFINFLPHILLVLIAFQITLVGLIFSIFVCSSNLDSCLFSIDRHVLKSVCNTLIASLTFCGVTGNYIRAKTI